MPAVWDAIVVGAGPSGMLAAERLAAQGRAVLVVDAGPRLPPGARVPEVNRKQWPFTTRGLGFDWYRTQAIGGRSLVWGGWAFRFPDQVLSRGGWPYGAGELAPWYHAVERRLGVVDGTVDARYATLPDALGVSVTPKRGAVGRDGAVWTPLDSAFAKAARAHTVALRLHHRGGVATALEVLDLAKDVRRRLRAHAMVLAASPIETARLLLLSELGRAGRGIGHGLCDHLVASYALLLPEPAPPPDQRGRFPGCALVEAGVNQGAGSKRPYQGGFCIELSGPAPLEAFGLDSYVPAAERARTSALQIHGIGEGWPHQRRRIDLDPAVRDAAGRPAPRLTVAFCRGERRLAADLRQACAAVASHLSPPGTRLLKFVDPGTPGAGHEAGTCSMAPGGPCDPWGALFALANVWVADASALPTPGDRHPTLTVLAHALRAADAAGRYLAGRPAPP